MTLEEIDLIARVRAETRHEDMLFVVIRGKVILFREDIVGLSDEDLIAMIRSRMNQQ